MTSFGNKPAQANAPILRSVARTHIGHVRVVNEDRLLNRVDQGLFAIADGMGGHSRGDVAADAVVHALACVVASPDPLTAERLCSAMREANRTVYGLSAQSSAQLGSTVVGLHLEGPDGFLFWAGDSRIYCLRAGALRLLTHDHRVVQEMMDAGVLAADAARDHPRASVITRAIGAQPELSLAVVHTAAEPGDVYLLCSDGLTDFVDDKTIGSLIRLPLAQAAEALVAAAMSAGGHDNISLILISVGCVVDDRTVIDATDTVVEAIA